MYTITDTPTRTFIGTVATYSEVKQQLNIESTFTDDDSYITRLIAVAIEQVEADINADVRNVTNVLTLRIDDDDNTDDNLYRIPRGPFQSFTKLEAQNNGVWADVPAASYKVTAHRMYIDVELLVAVPADYLRFTYATGYATASLPAKLKHAVILKAADLYDTERSNYAPGQVFDLRTYERLLLEYNCKYW